MTLFFFSFFVFFFFLVIFLFFFFLFFFVFFFLFFFFFFFFLGGGGFDDLPTSRLAPYFLFLASPIYARSSRNCLFLSTRPSGDARFVRRNLSDGWLCLAPCPAVLINSIQDAHPLQLSAWYMRNAVRLPLSF